MAASSAVSDLIGAIDQGTSSCRFLLFDTATSEVVAQHQKEMQHFTPEEDWLEQDPMEMLDLVRECIAAVCKECAQKGIDLNRIKGVGITNQRETTILWDRATGKPLYNAVVWCDNRAAGLAEKLIDATPTQKEEHFQDICGLRIHPYFSALKIRWLMDNIHEVQNAITAKTCLFGTVDTWLMWNLMEGASHDCHVTDVSNASRTMLMNLKTVAWDDQLCTFFGVPKEILPSIVSSAQVYGYLAEGPLKGVPICGCLGDQSAALVGQNCLAPGKAKNTYGTGCFLLCNTGTAFSPSHHRLLTTVAYQLGPHQPVHYALEGSIAVGGQVVRWLRDKLGIIKESREVGDLAGQVSSNAGVYFVPAFNGLYAPYWDTSARGLIIGLTQFTNRCHIARAALESVCYQTREILEAMSKDSGTPVSTLHVDGGMTENSLLMQLQADIAGLDVVRSHMVEITALGAARAAGVALGVWPLNMGQQPVESSTFKPKISTDERDQQYSRWKKAVKRALKWETRDEGPPASHSLIGPLAVVGGTLAALGSVAAILLYFKTQK